MEQIAATTLKTLDAAEGRVGGYLVVWGSPQQRDLQGEYFTPHTDFGLDWYAQRPVLYHHGLDGHLKTAVIGVIDRLRADDTGLWAEAQLDLRKRYVRTVQRLVDKGVLGWSSGSLPHLVEVADDGRIARWPIVEGSLTPAPAEPRRTDVHTIKSAYDALGLDTSRLGIEADDSTGTNHRAPTASQSLPPAQFPPSPYTGRGPGGGVDAPPSHIGRGDLLGRPYDPSQLPSLPSPLPTQWGGAGGGDNSSIKGNPMDNELTLLQEEERPARKRLPLSSSNDALKTNIAVASPYDTLEAMDMLHGYVMLRSAKSFHGVSEQYANALTHKIRKAGLSAIKADELSYSTQSGFGDEWVPDLWSAQIWNKARLENIILPLFRTVEMPSNPFELPIEGADPTVYFVPETANENQLALDSANNAIPDSKIGSGKVQLAAKKLALRVGFSSELVEDSILPVLNIYREQAMRAIADSIDHVLLNGDTESGATGNINSDHTTPPANSRYLAFNGLRKLPLVTNTANKVDMSNAAPTLAKLRETRFTMAAKYSARPSDLAWIVDGGTYAKMLSIAEFLTMDKAGPMATALTGQIGFADGAPVLVSAEMPLTEADGKIGGATNDRGQAVCVYRPGWFVGYRRKIAVSVDYLPYYDSYQLTATVRLAFVNFDTDVVSALFNIAL
jgi:HK97 family phage major capsid protein